MPSLISVLPVDPSAVHVISASMYHARAVSDVAPSTTAGVVHKVVHSVPDTPIAGNSVRLLVVPPDVRTPLARSRSCMPVYHCRPFGWPGRTKSWVVGACGLMVAVAAVLSVAPCAVCHGAPALSRFTQDCCAMLSSYLQRLRRLPARFSPGAPRPFPGPHFPPSSFSTPAPP